MSKTKLGIRLSGDLPSQDDLTRILGVPVTISSRRGDWNIYLDGKQDYDVAIIDLLGWGEHLGEGDDCVPLEQLLSKIALVQNMAPSLSMMNRSEVQKELYVSCVRTMDQGGMNLPAELIAFAAAAGLSLSISITVVLDD